MGSYAYDAKYKLKVTEIIEGLEEFYCDEYGNYSEDINVHLSDLSNKLNITLSVQGGEDLDFTSSYSDEMIEMHGDGTIIRFKMIHCFELKATKNEEEFWFRGGQGPCEGEDGFHYTGEYKAITDYIIEEEDLKTHEVKVYRMNCDEKSKV